jgi:hypothetical protein
MALCVCVGFADANTLTAKEAHDKLVECEKKCARVPNLLRCQQQCRQYAQYQHHSPAQSSPKRNAEKNKPVVVQGKPKRTVLLKGRRVTLEMRQRKH